MNILSEFKKLCNIIIQYFQWISIIFGAIFVFIGIYLKQLHGILGDLICNFGGTFLSIGLISVVYQKWKDRKDNAMREFLEGQIKELTSDFQNHIQSFDAFRHDWEKQNTNKKEEKYFLMGSSFLGTGEQLQEIVNIDRHTGKIILIGSMSDNRVSKEYGFTTLLNGDNFKLLNLNEPLFSYGTSFYFLNEPKQRNYYEIIKKAIEKGMGLRISILYPDKNNTEMKNIDDYIEKSQTTIQDFKNLISIFINEKTDLSCTIELKLARYFSPCSFSSLEFSNKRTIRSLEFNFINEKGTKQKLAQVYDNKPSEDDKDNIHNTFSQCLYNRYNKLYKESILALRYPMTRKKGDVIINNDITYYVLGTFSNELDNTSIMSKKIVLDIEKKIFHVVVGQHIDTRFKYIVKTDNNIIEYTEQDFKDESLIPYDLHNTIIGNVLMDFKKQTNGCIINPICSFEHEKDTNTFLLLGKIVKMPEDFHSFICPCVERDLHPQLLKIGFQSFEKEIKSIIKMS